MMRIMKGDHLSEEYAKVNPMKQSGWGARVRFPPPRPDAGAVPAMEADGLTLAESRAIMTYLANSRAPSSSLYPSDPKQRAFVDQYLNWHHACVRLRPRGGGGGLTRCAGAAICAWAPRARS